MPLEILNPQSLPKSVFEIDLIIDEAFLEELSKESDI